jgi:PTS system mannose-specific IIC component
MLSGLSLAARLSLSVLIGAFISLDYVACAQLMVSTPLVLSSILGWLLGNFSLGLTVGIAFQLLWLVDAAVGAHIPPDGSAGAQIATIGTLCCFPSGAVAEWNLSLAALVAIPFALFSGVAERWVRTANTHLQNWVISALEEEPREITRLGMTRLRLSFLVGMLALFLKAVVVIGLGSTLCYLVLYYANQWNLPEPLTRGLGWGWRLIPAVGVGSAVRYFLSKRWGIALTLLGLSGALAVLIFISR